MLHTHWSGEAWRRSTERHSRASALDSGVTVLADLLAFLQEHRRCGDITAKVEDDRVWMTCTCGAVINRSVDD
jgi:hypothetical protein